MTPADRDSIAHVRELFSAADGRRVTSLIRRYGDDPRVGVQALVAGARSRRDAEREERARTVRLYAMESDLREQGLGLVAGLDEVGRGALAGPVTAAAVILANEPLIEGLDDSKRLTPLRREHLATTIHADAVAVSIAHVSAADVDSLGMTAALRMAMRLAISGLSVAPDHVLLDGLPMHVVDNETAVVKGDAKIAAIAAASIVAKVARDALMCQLAEKHPEYLFDVNKGYGTSEHLAAIARVGLSPVHRRSFTVGGGTLSMF